MEFDSRFQDRWKFSVFGGTLALVIAGIGAAAPADFGYSLGGIFGLLALGCSFAGACAGVFSLLAKEEKRAWSALGILLSLVVPGVIIALFLKGA